MIKIKLNELLDKEERNLHWLAKKCDISYSTMYNFANNKTNAVSYTLLDSICKVLKCKLDDIINFIED